MQTRGKVHSLHMQDPISSNKNSLKRNQHVLQIIFEVELHMYLSRMEFAEAFNHDVLQKIRICCTKDRRWAFIKPVNETKVAP